MRRKKKSTAQKTLFDVFLGCFLCLLCLLLCFLFVPSLFCLPVVFLVPFGLVVALPLSCHFGHLFLLHEQLLTVVVAVSVTVMVRRLQHHYNTDKTYY